MPQTRCDGRDKYTVTLTTFNESIIVCRILDGDGSTNCFLGKICHMQGNFRKWPNDWMSSGTQRQYTGQSRKDGWASCYRDLGDTEGVEQIRSDAFALCCKDALAGRC